MGKWTFIENVGILFFSLWDIDKKDGLGKFRENEEKSLPEESIRVFFVARRALKPDQHFDYDAKKAWEKIGRETNRNKPQVFFRKVWKYAAVIVLLLTVSVGYLWIKEQRAGILIARKNDPALPDSQKVKLLLANGETVLLDSLLEDKVVGNLGITLKNAYPGGKLHYQVTDRKDSVGVFLNTLTVPKGGEYSLFLADGSEVWVNSLTSLQFPVGFDANKREVWLDGEAYFKITKNQEVPFLVHTRGYDITVLGTIFNVSVYEDDPLWQTTLVDGKVQISKAGQKLLLEPSDQCSLNPLTGRMTLEKVDPELYTSWIDGKFYFSAYPFEEIVRKLERWYDFTMIYTDEAIRHKRFSGTIHKDQPLEEMLHYLEKISDIHFKISGGKIIAFEMKRKR